MAVEMRLAEGYTDILSLRDNEQAVAEYGRIAEIVGSYVYRSLFSRNREVHVWVYNDTVRRYVL